MKYIKQLISPVFLIIIYGFTSSLNQSSEIYGDLYKKGKNAYNNKNYVDALKYLYSYKVVNEDKLFELEPKFLKQLNSAIAECEIMLRQKLIVIRENNRTNRSYFNGNELPPYLVEFIDKSNLEKPLTILGDNKHKLPSTYYDYLKSVKLEGLEKVDFVEIKDNKYTVDVNKLNTYLENKKGRQSQLESINKAIEFQLNYQEIILKEKQAEINR